MYDIELNSDLLHLVKKKRIVIIGPAPYLVGQKMGSTFDKFDIIIRPNDFAIMPHLKQDYGSRTDIMFHNLGTPWMPGLREKIQNNSDEFRKLKLVGCLATKADHSQKNYLSWPDDHVSDVVKNFNEVNVHNIPFYWIGNRDYRKLYHKIGVEPNTGIMSIIVLLHYPIKELFLSGFSFYLHAHSHDNTYCEGFLPEADKKIYNGKYGRRHGDNANNVQIKFFKMLAKENTSTLKTDSTIKMLLGL